jgi:hypothetical protein
MTIPRQRIVDFFVNPRSRVKRREDFVACIDLKGADIADQEVEDDRDPARFDSMKPLIHALLLCMQSLGWESRG